MDKLKVSLITRVYTVDVIAVSQKGISGSKPALMLPNSFCLILQFDFFSHLYLSCSSSHTSSSIHYTSDSSQGLLAAPQSILPAKVSRYGRADYVGRPTDEESGNS